MGEADVTRREYLGKDGIPGAPATQCHNLLGVLRHSLEASGIDLPVRSEDIDNMALTVPLRSLPRRGLLPPFDGNIINDNGDYTGQVLFTGADGKQSHTWLVIGDEPYDPVLGTRGAEVANAVANQFDWVVPDQVGKGNGGWYIVRDSEKKAAPNDHGFGSAYRLTKTPENSYDGEID